jgi:predicted Fe-S protein YdhL (DUF1289 family)
VRPNKRIARRLFTGPDWRVWHVPGVSRAWCRDYPDGAYVLVTDAPGYDLPDPGGPYAVYYLTANSAVVESVPLLPQPNSLVHWLRHIDRLRARAADLVGGETNRRHQPHPGVRRPIASLDVETLSPCIGKCDLDRASACCTGCHRTIDEITRWSRLSNLQKRKVVEQCQTRSNGCRAE